ncbi:MAG: type III-B CRISPR module-associated protein Cmr5 [candidate division WOR-3 bacterium]
MLSSRDQERAKAAWKCVSEVQGKEAIEKYASLAKSAPVMILTNGLGQTLAFFISKANGRNEYSVLLDHLTQWLYANVPWTTPRAGTLIEQVMGEASPGYRLATEEALAFLSWVKRFATAKAPE